MIDIEFIDRWNLWSSNSFLYIIAFNRQFDLPFNYHWSILFYIEIKVWSINRCSFDSFMLWTYIHIQTYISISFDRITSLFVILSSSGVYVDIDIYIYIQYEEEKKRKKEKSEQIDQSVLCIYKWRVQIHRCDEFRQSTQLSIWIKNIIRWLSSVERLE